MQAHCKLSLKILREMLRLPTDVTISGVRADPQDSTSCILDLQSPRLPSSGELLAEYSFQHTTVINFKGWKQPDEQKEETEKSRTESASDI